MAIASIISLGIGEPAEIPTFILFGLYPDGVVPVPPSPRVINFRAESLTIDLRAEVLRVDLRAESLTIALWAQPLVVLLFADVAPTPLESAQDQTDLRADVAIPSLRSEG
jgi:hypothetical protein